MQRRPGDQGFIGNTFLWDIINIKIITITKINTTKTISISINDLINMK